MVNYCTAKVGKIPHPYKQSPDLIPNNLIRYVVSINCTILLNPRICNYTINNIKVGVTVASDKEIELLDTFAVSNVITFADHKVVYIQEEGWADANDTPTHAILMLTSGCYNAFHGHDGNVMWVDNVALVYED